MYHSAKFTRGLHLRNGVGALNGKSISRAQLPCLLRTTSRSVARAAVPELSNLPQVMDYFEKDRRPIVLFDGVCNFCNGGVNFVMDWDSNRVFRFAALQSDCGQALLEKCGRKPDDISSMVVVEPDAFHIKSDAALVIADKLNLPLPAISLFIRPVPKFARDVAYDFIADNRYSWLGKRDQCRIPTAKDAERFVV